tara:strand:- start:675 stop:971 length:297 start_codon:yes stop_codon:yes gene_type:complete
MIKSQILEKLQKKYKNFNSNDIEILFDIFVNKISKSLKKGNNIEIRGFGTISKKLNREKFVRNPKTNERIFKKNSYKLHFKIGKILHNRINSKSGNEF